MTQTSDEDLNNLTHILDGLKQDLHKKQEEINVIISLITDIYKQIIELYEKKKTHKK